MDFNYSQCLKDTIFIAQAYVKEYHNERLGAAHILKALMHKNAGLQGFLKSLNKDPLYIAEWAEVRIEGVPKSNKISDQPVADEVLASIFDEAENIRFKLGFDQIDSVCVLCAIIKPGYAFSSDQLKSLPINENEVIGVILENNKVENTVKIKSKDSDHVIVNNSKGAVFLYCIDRNEKYKQDKTDPVVGRDKEVLMMIEILGRRNKPNVLLIGDAGVGKSAMIDGLIKKIASKQVLATLESAVIFELDSGALFAGASYKGEIEDRMKRIISDLQSFQKSILFIDEIHTLLDSKGPSGSSIANLLKPELARGELTIIGTTTQVEYRKVIELDAGLNRRFETVIINEPDFLTATKMVCSVIKKYEDHHSITANKEVIAEAVRLAKRYLKDKRLPDSAIDLLDRTMAAVTMMNETSLGEVLQFQADIRNVAEDNCLTEEERVAEYQWLFNQLINSISPVLKMSITDELDISLMSDPVQILNSAELIVSKYQEVLQQAKSEITKSDISAIIAIKTGIPIGKIQTQEKEKLINIGDHLKKRVVGQNHAIKILSDTILESRSGMNKQGQPIGSFFFLGPTGTGKTELTKAIAEFLFNDEKAMIRFDMSEFKEEHSAALLYGAPPGYIGYEEGGLLVNKIRQQPYSVVLFDEIEKAHPSVFDIFLQIMDEGTLHDKLGKVGDFSNAIVIFTSNIGSEWVAEQFGNGILPASSLLMDVMAKSFRPEFLARLSEIVPFAPISEENVVKIFEIQLKSLSESLFKQDVALIISHEAKKIMAKSGFTPRYGARQLSSVIRNRLRRPIARMLITGELIKGDELRINKQNGSEELDWLIIRGGEILNADKTEYNTIEI